MKFKNKLKYIFSISLTSFIGSSSLFYLFSPIALQRGLSIKSISSIENITLFDKSYNSYSINEIYNQIRSIPYKKGRGVYSIYPREKLKKTIIEGNGNCSNLSFGSSIYSMYNRKKSVPIKLFTNEGFLKGSGHTVQLIGLEKDNNIIVDFLEGGIPLKCGNPIDLKKLFDKDNCQLGFKVISTFKDDFNSYFTEKEFIKYTIGLHSQIEIDRYHKFLEAIYFPLFNQKFEKIFFDSISLITGFYPKTYINKNGWDTLFKNKKYLLIISKIWIYSFWLSFSLSIYYLITKLIKLMKK